MLDDEVFWYNFLEEDAEDNVLDEIINSNSNSA